MTHAHSFARAHKIRNTKRSLMRQLLKSFLEFESIDISIYRAKALKMIIEPLITIAKKENLLRANNDAVDLNNSRIVALRRQAFAKIQSKTLTKKLFEEIGPRFLNRPGGYLRIIRTTYRKSDSTPMANISLVEQTIGA